MTDLPSGLRQPQHWIIKIRTAQERDFKHPLKFVTFDEAATFKESLDKQLREETILTLFDKEKLLDISINTNQIVSMKVSAVYEHGDEDDGYGGGRNFGPRANAPR